MSSYDPRSVMRLYLAVFVIVLVFTALVYVLFVILASTTSPKIDKVAIEIAIRSFASVAETGADLVKVALGAVIGALGSSLHFALDTRKEAEGAGGAS